MKTIYALFIFFFISILTGCRPVPPGILTIIKGQFINKLTQEPISDKIVQIEECGISFFSASDCGHIVDTVHTDANGKFEYAFFHDTGNAYYLDLSYSENPFCFEKVRVPNGTLVEEVYNIKPLLPLLEVDLKTNPTDSIDYVSINFYSSSPCLSRIPQNHFRHFAPEFEIDTTPYFFVAPFDSLTITFSKRQVGKPQTKEEKKIFIENEVVRVSF